MADIITYMLLVGVLSALLYLSLALIRSMIRERRRPHERAASNGRSSSIEPAHQFAIKGFLVEGVREHPPVEMLDVLDNQSGEQIAAVARKVSQRW